MNFIFQKLDAAHFEILTFIDTAFLDDFPFIKYDKNKAEKSGYSTSILPGTYFPIVNGDSLVGIIEKMLRESLRSINLEAKRADRYFIPCVKIKYNPNFIFGDSILSPKSRNEYTSHPRFLNLQRYLPIEIPRGSTNSLMDLITIDVPFQLDMSKYFVQEPTQVKDYIYSLRSFTVHRGREVNSGHFVTYVLDVGTREWFLFNDHYDPVRVTDMNRLMNELCGQANVLFYEMD